MKKMLACVLGLLIWGIFGMNAYGETLQIVTEEYSPYNYMEDGKIVGLSTEIVEATVSKAGFEKTLKLYPWPRAYKMVLKDKNTLIYTITRNEEREKSFKWVGPIAPRAIVIYKLKTRDDIKVNTLEDAKKYKIGVVRDGAFNKELQSKGFVIGKNLMVVATEKLNIRKLYKGRIDLFGAVPISLAYQSKKEGFDFNKLTEVYKVPSNTAYYMALNLKTSDEIVNKLQVALDGLKEDGTYQKIMDKYLK